MTTRRPQITQRPQKGSSRTISWITPPLTVRTLRLLIRRRQQGTIMSLCQRLPVQIVRRRRAALARAFAAAVLLAGWWFYPVWSGEVIPYDAWRLRMWFSTWV